MPNLGARGSSLQTAGMQHQANEQRINHLGVQCPREGEKCKRKQKSLHVKY